MGSIELKLRMANSIGDIAAEAWDACANPGASKPPSHETCCKAPPYNPFCRIPSCMHWSVSGSVRARTGWQPLHLLAEDRCDNRSAPSRATSNPTAAANMSSTTAGPRPTNGSAGATIPSFRFRCPSRRSPARGCWRCRGRMPIAAPNPCRGARRELPALGASSVHVTFITAPEWHLLGREWLAETHRSAVPLGQSRLW